MLTALQNAHLANGIDLGKFYWNWPLVDCMTFLLTSENSKSCMGIRDAENLECCKYRVWGSFWLTFCSANKFAKYP